jgi:hypothetical protein
MTEVGGRVAGQAIDALKSQPFLLAMLIFNALFIGVVYYSVNQADTRHEKQVTELMERCLPKNSAL